MKAPLHAGTWEICADVPHMLQAVRPDPHPVYPSVRKASDRKLRLLACAAARTRWPQMIEADARQAVDVAEEFADDLATSRQMTRHLYLTLPFSITPRHTPEEAACNTCSGSATAAAWGNRHKADAGMVRCIMGNPWQPQILPPACLTRQIALLALDAYNERPPRQCPACLGKREVPVLHRSVVVAHFVTCGTCHGEGSIPYGHLDGVRLAILADAMEEAGATGSIVSHLRLPGPHYRGCWPLDLVLGKT